MIPKKEPKTYRSYLLQKKKKLMLNRLFLNCPFLLYFVRHSCFSFSTRRCAITIQYALLEHHKDVAQKKQSLQSQFKKRQFDINFFGQSKQTPYTNNSQTHTLPC